MMSLNQPRTRRITDSGGTTTGKRGRPESLVRKYWADIGVEGVGPKCIFCDHRSVTRVFRAPPATRHTLICKSAPEDVKKQLRSATNNKYSRRTPQSSDNPNINKTTSSTTGATAPRVSSSVVVPSRPPPGTNPNPQPHQHQHQQTHPDTAAHFATASPPPDTNPIPAMPSPRHLSAGVVNNMAAAAAAAAPHGMHTTPMDSVVAPTRTAALLGERNSRTVAHVNTLAQASNDILYGNNPRGVLQHALQHDDSGLERANAPTAPNPHSHPHTNPTNSAHGANAALAAAVIEALFANTNRKKVGAIPTPAEFRAALQEFKERAVSKAKRQRNEAREDSARFQNAISMLVGRSVDVGARAQEPDSDDSDDELHDVAHPNVAAVAAARRADWGNGYERVHK